MSMNVSPHIPQVVVNSAAITTESLAKSNAAKEVIPPTVKVEANVPQKSREQDSRSPAESLTYNNIQSRFEADALLEQEQQEGQEQQDQQQESAEQQNRSEQDLIQSDESENSSSQDDKTDTAASANSTNTNQEQISEQEQAVIEQLQSRDQEVRAHEQAHAAVGGSLAGAPSYDYQTGPDGKRYAVGGEVSIDVSKEADPQDTIRKMQTVQAAALAPAEPSSQDRKVAAQAAQNIAEARMELATESVKSDEKNTVKVADQNENSEQKANASELTDPSNSLDNAKTNAELAQDKMDNEKVMQTANVIANKYASSSVIADIQFSAVA